MKHLRQDVGNLKVVVLGASGSSHPHLVGVSFDHGDDIVMTNDGNRPDVHRNTRRQLVVAGLAHLGAHERLGDQALVVVGDRLTDDVVLQGRRAGVRTYLGGCPEHIGVLVRNPQDEIREGRVSEHLPVVDKFLEPRDVGGSEAGPVSDQTIDGRHAVTLVTRIQPAPTGINVSTNVRFNLGQARPIRQN